MQQETEALLLVFVSFDRGRRRKVLGEDGDGSENGIQPGAGAAIQDEHAAQAEANACRFHVTAHAVTAGFAGEIHIRIRARAQPQKFTLHASEFRSRSLHDFHPFLL